MSSEAEVLVIGGGPAGLASAIALRQQGMEVTVADGAKPPIDKTCGEGLMPQTLQSLGELGVELPPALGKWIQGLRFVDGRTSVGAHFPEKTGRGFRRIVLHQRLVERAQELGTSFLWNTPVTGLCSGGAIVGGAKMRARWIVGGDGIRSRVRRWACLESGSHRVVRFAHQRHYRVKPWADFVEIYWCRKMQLYVTPIGDEEICLVLTSRESGPRFEDALLEYPELAEKLKGAELSNVHRGAITATYTLDRVSCENVVLIGDASGGIDAITGEGLNLCFRQALALARALKAGTFESYTMAHRRLARRPLLLSRALLFLDRNPQLRKRIFRKFERDTALFGRLLGMQWAQNSFSDVAEAAARLCWQLLTA
jgi:flavin-dependent dehydrogenase